MNYYDARERKDGRWDYTRMNDGHVSPAGYCAAEDGCGCRTIERGYGIDPDCTICSGKGRVPNPEYCGSHDTPEEARALRKAPQLRLSLPAGTARRWADDRELLMANTQRTTPRTKSDVLTCPNPFCDGYGNIDISPSIIGRAWALQNCWLGPHPPEPAGYRPKSRPNMQQRAERESARAYQ